MRERIRTICSSRTVKYLATAIAVVLAVAAVVSLKTSAERRVYTGYVTERLEEKTDNVSRYAYVDGYVLRYSIDGAALLNSSLTTLWTATYSMMDPRVDLCGSTILIYDRLGTQICIFGKKGQLASFTADGPLLNARVSGKRTVAALIRDGEKVDFIYYSEDGAHLASGEASMSDPGYPVALALSKDGVRVAISYIVTAGGAISTCLRFYYFGNGGKGRENNMTGESVFEGVLIPEVDYLSNDECVAFRDDGFTVFRGSTKVSEYRSVDFDKEIVSAIHDGSHMGFLFPSEEKEHRFKMKIYSTSGNLVSTCYVDQAYTRAHVCGDEVIFSSGTDFSVYSMKGFCRYSGRIQSGSIADVLRIGGDRILALTDYTMEVLRLK